jgi:hypothetical protein
MNNDFVKYTKKSWGHLPVSQPALLGNLCDNNDENWSKWCMVPSKLPNELNYEHPANDNENLLQPVKETRPNRDYTETISPDVKKSNLDFVSRETLSLCDLDKTIPNGNDNDNRFFSWDKPEDLLYSQEFNNCGNKEQKKEEHNLDISKGNIYNLEHKQNNVVVPNVIPNVVVPNVVVSKEVVSKEVEPNDNLMGSLMGAIFDNEKKIEGNVLTQSNNIEKNGNVVIQPNVDLTHSNDTIQKILNNKSIKTMPDAYDEMMYKPAMPSESSNLSTLVKSSTIPESTKNLVDSILKNQDYETKQMMPNISTTNTKDKQVVESGFSSFFNKIFDGVIKPTSNVVEKFDNVITTTVETMNPKVCKANFKIMRDLILLMGIIAFFVIIYYIVMRIDSKV